MPLRERRVRLGRQARLRLDADAVLDRELVAHVEVPFFGPALARAGHEDHTGPVTRTDEAVLGVRRAVDEVPRLQVPLLAFDDDQALAGEHEEVLLVRLAVVAAARLSRLEDGDRVPELRERRLVAF